MMDSRRIPRLVTEETRDSHQLRMWVAQLRWLSKYPVVYSRRGEGKQVPLPPYTGIGETWTKPAREIDWFQILFQKQV